MCEQLTSRSRKLKLLASAKPKENLMRFGSIFMGLESWYAAAGNAADIKILIVECHSESQYSMMYKSHTFLYNV